MAEDADLGLVTIESARADYGVVINPLHGLDAEATERVRSERWASSGPRPAFDRGARFSTHVAAGDIRLTTTD